MDGYIKKTSHIVFTTNSGLEVSIRPLDPEHDLLTKEQIFGETDGDPQAAFECISNDYHDHINIHDHPTFFWAITNNNQTIGFLDYSKPNKELKELTICENFKNEAIAVRCIYLTKAYQNMGIGSAACDITTDLLMTAAKKSDSDFLILTTKYGENTTSMKLTKQTDGWQLLSTVDKVNRRNLEEKTWHTFGLDCKNYHKKQTIPPYTVINF